MQILVYLNLMNIPQLLQKGKPPGGCEQQWLHLLALSLFCNTIKKKSLLIALALITHLMHYHKHQLDMHTQPDQTGCVYSTTVHWYV